MRNVKKYAQAGKEVINGNAHYDIQVSDIRTILDMAEENLFQAIEYAFYAGVEAGSRIEKKANKAR